MKKVQEEARQAKQVAQQLKKDKAINQQFAQFLAFLMQEIGNEQIIKGIYDTFFTTVDYKTNITYLRKNMNTIVVVGLFYPFYLEQAQAFGVDAHFSKLLNAKGHPTIREYVSYLQELSNHYHDNVPINQSHFITLLAYIIREYLSHVADAPQLVEGESEIDTYRNLTYQYLFG